ncbi:MAG: pyridoxamine 5'-phosphate oxidase family protein [Leeuwenhoekiella sp.]
MSTKNLYNKEAQKKIKDLAEDIDFVMMATNLGKKPVSAIPMSTKKVDEDGNIWFLSGKNSDHNKDIEMDSNIQLLYSDPSSMRFLSVYSEAQIVTDKSVLKELYGKTDDNWFDGVDDPNLTALKCMPKESFYWDTKNNKLVTLFKMGVGAVTGNQPDISEQGKIKV